MTGYTQELVDSDLDFPRFALLCARAFGACVMMRDCALSTPIPAEFKPSDHHKKEGVKTKNKLVKLMKLTSKKEREEWASKELKKQISLLKKHATPQGVESNHKKMQAILAEVENWVPPSEEHTPLKSYMQEQLQSSLQSDGYHYGYYDGEVEKLQKTAPLAYYLDEVKRLKENVAYHKKGWDAEVAIINQRNKWIKKLRESLYSTKA